MVGSVWECFNFGWRPAISACSRGLLSVLAGVGMATRDVCILAGPKTPYWSCHCGSAGNYASRIKCRCGREAPHRIVHAAREAAKRINAPTPSHGRGAAGAWAKGPPGAKGGPTTTELAKLRAEVAQLRAAAKNDSKMDVEGEGDEESAGVDIQKAHAAYLATVAAFGPNSKRAQDMEADVAELRASRQQAMPVSRQIRALERKVGDKRKQVDAARLAATVAAETVREAQRVLEAADEKVVHFVTKLQEADKELQELCKRPAEPTVEEHGAMLLALGSVFEADGEAAQALNVLRSKMAAKAERIKESGSVPVEENSTGHGSETSAGSNSCEFTPMQVEELERQAINAKRTADQAEQKLQSAKSARVSPY